MLSTKLLLRGSASVLALVIAAPFLAKPAHANPVGGAVTSGSASIANPSSTTTQVRQTSEGVVIDWSSFNVGKGQTTTFVQPNAQAIAVNRIGGNSATQIFGTLDANGRIVLINGNGLLFGKGSQVNVGSLVATSSDANDADMLAGKANFSKTGNANAQIVNRGTIAASQGGYVALVAPTVTSRGTVQAKLGNVTLAGASNFTLDFNGDGLVSFAAPAAGHGQVTNSGNLSGATITMDARSAEGAAVGVVNAGGTIVAQGAHLQGGSIVLDGGGGGNIDVSGSLNASGASGGGVIAVGYSGDSLAGKVTLEKSSVLSADATQAGNGGTVKIDSQNDTNFNGTISAKGAAGAGGNVELSTKGVLQFTGFADISAISGKAGTLLLDPTDLFINATGTPPEAGASGISVATLESELASGDVTLKTAATGSQPGNIVVGSSFGWSSGNSLSLEAYRSIYLNNHVTVTDSGGYSFQLHADDTGRGVGTVIFTGNSVIDANNAGVYIDYNPVNYDTPTNFSGNVILTNGAFLYGNMLVNNLPDLQEIGKDATTLSGSYVLGRSINAAATSGWNSGAGFVPIGDAANPFTGDFSAFGYTISHLFIDNSGDDVGLFGAIGASGFVSYTNLTAASITGGSYTGGLAGANSGVIEFSSVSGTVNGSAYTGGLVGTNSGLVQFDTMNGTVTGQAYTGGLIGASTTEINFGTSKGSVAGADYVGGLVGYTVASVVSSSSSDIVTGSDDLGGLIGENNGGSIASSHATGKVTGGSDLGGLIGLEQSGASITGSYATGAVTGSAYVGGLVGNDIDSTIGTSYASGNVEATETGANAKTFAGGLVGEYVLDSASSGAITSSHATGSVTAGGQYNGGLVGYNDANITSSYATGDVTPLAGAESSSFLGGLAGYNDGTITSSHATGSVTGATSIGGLVGENANSTVALPGIILSSYANGMVQAYSSNSNSIGGLVGDNSNGASIEKSYATGSISLSPSFTGTNAIGGLVGINIGTVTNSYSNELVTAAPDSFEVGGFVGVNYGDVSGHSYETGKVTGGLQDIGGFAGENESGGEIANSYATGNVEATLGTVSGIDSTNIGGLVGENQGTVLAAYATGTVSGNDVVGGLVGADDTGATISKAYATGATTATANPAVVGDGTVAGGLVGSATGTISYVYATGNVGGYDDVGGLIGSAASGLKINQAYSTGSASASSSTPIALGASIGLNNGATLTDVYWDSSTNPTLAGVGSGANSTTPLTTAQLMSGLPTGFNASVWGSSATINNGLPYLLALPPS